jgi:hypothetical protein
MNEQELALIEKFGAALSENGKFVVDAYTRWSLAASICWVIFGILLVAFPFIQKIDIPNKEDGKWVNPIIKYAIIFFGCLFIFANIPDIFSPEGYALHKLITDLVPNSK